MSRYKFNRDQLKFDEERRGLGSLIALIVKYIVGSVLLMVLYYLVYAFIFNTREEERLINENEMLSMEYERVVDRFDLLDSVIHELSERDKDIYMSLFKAMPQDFGVSYGSGLYYQLDTASEETIVAYSSGKISSLETVVDKISLNMDRILNAVEAGKDSILQIPSILPIKGMDVSQTGAGFGSKIHPFYKTMADHTGIDLLSVIGSEVRSTVDGIVRDVVRSDRGRGNQVTIINDRGYSVYYAHLGEILVREGQAVHREAVIARVGNSGLSFAPHLHYEVHINGLPMDPINYFFGELQPKNYREMMVIALNNGQSMD